MAVNKVVINHDGVENVLVDITDSTVTPETLAEGETAYGANGEKIIGTMTGGIDTSDATATEEDILIMRTAYVNGEKITGRLGLTSGGIIFSYAGHSVLWDDTDEGLDGEPSIAVIGEVTKRHAFDQGAHIGGRAKASRFGDAEPKDVAKGKTFTSASGLRVVGTGSTTIDITDDGNGNLKIANASVTYDNGNLHITT